MISPRTQYLNFHRGSQFLQSFNPLIFNNRDTWKRLQLEGASTVYIILNMCGFFYQRHYTLHPNSE